MSVRVCRVCVRARACMCKRYHKTSAGSVVLDQSAKVLSINTFYPKYFAVQGSQSTNVLSARACAI